MTTMTFNVNDKIRLNPELCPADKLEQKHFQFGALNYPVLVLDWECEVTDSFQDQYHGNMVAFKVLNDDRIEPDTIVYFRADDCILSKETKLKIDFTILGKILKVQPLLDLDLGQQDNLDQLRAQMKASGMSIKKPELQANWKEIQGLKAEYEKLAKNTETVFLVKVPRLGQFELDCKEEDIERTLRREIRKQRAASKLIVPQEKVIAGNIKYEKVGGVMKNVGEFAKINKDFAIKVINEPKKPTNANDNFIGVEIEGFAPITREKMKEEFIKAGLKRDVSIVDDASIRPAEGTYGMEIRVIVKQSEYEVVLKKIYNLLEDLEFEVNASCGSHVHLDMRNRNPELAYANLYKVQNLMMATQPKTRRTNTYCKPAKKPELTLAEFKDQDRYHAINVQSFSKHQTIEIRLHNGTSKYEDMKSWIEFLLTVVDLNTKMSSDISTIAQLEVSELKMSKETINHLKKRVQYNKPSNLETYLNIELGGFYLQGNDSNRN